LVLLSGVAALLAACSSGANPSGVATHKASTFRQQNKEAGKRPELAASSQHSSGTAVMIKTVTLPERRVLHQSAGHGYVALATDQGGKPGQIVGTTRLKDGTTRNVTINVPVKLLGGKYFVLLFESNKVPSSVSGAIKSKVIRVSVR
jgi:hypothetical protein